MSLRMKYSLRLTEQWINRSACPAQQGLFRTEKGFMLMLNIKHMQWLQVLRAKAQPKNKFRVWIGSGQRENLICSCNFIRAGTSVEQPCAWCSGAELSRNRKCFSSFYFQNTTVVVLTAAFLAIAITQSRAEAHPFTLNIGIKQVAHVDDWTGLLKRKRQYLRL